MAERSGGAVAISCRRVSKAYRRGSVSTTALTSVDMDAAVGQITALFGPSGSGKSTLLRLLGAVDRPDEGDVMLGTTTISRLSVRRRRRLRRSVISYVFQEPAHNLVDYLDAREQLVLAVRLRGGDGTGMDDLLETVGLGHRLHHLPTQLSGGEQQRLAVAAAVVGDPQVVLCDEPTAELDAASGARVLSTIVELSRRGTSFVIASHDPAVRDVADVVYELTHGRMSG
jgi:putative ABC transport system ATP-binding protein